MQDKNSIVYYVVAAVSIFVLISYGTSRDIPPMVGFLIAGVSTYILYPNQTVALSVALIVSAILRKTREGYEDDASDDAPKNPLVSMMETTEPAEEDVEDAEEEPEEKEKKKKDKKDKKNKKPSPYQKKEDFALTPADFNPSTSTQDMDKLSGMIDKTMKLIEMLPEGFLNNASK